MLGPCSYIAYIGFLPSQIDKSYSPSKGESDPDES
jgi:hypothetical protein